MAFQIVSRGSAPASTASTGRMTAGAGYGSPVPIQQAVNQAPVFIQPPLRVASYGGSPVGSIASALSQQPVGSPAPAPTPAPPPAAIPYYDPTAYGFGSSYGGGSSGAYDDDGGEMDYGDDGDGGFDFSGVEPSSAGFDVSDYEDAEMSGFGEQLAGDVLERSSGFHPFQALRSLYHSAVYSAPMRLQAKAKAPSLSGPLTITVQHGE